MKLDLNGYPPFQGVIFECAFCHKIPNKIEDSVEICNCYAPANYIAMEPWFWNDLQTKNFARRRRDYEAGSGLITTFEQYIELEKVASLYLKPLIEIIQSN